MKHPPFISMDVEMKQESRMGLNHWKREASSIQ